MDAIAPLATLSPSYALAYDFFIYVHSIDTVIKNIIEERERGTRKYFRDKTIYFVARSQKLVIRVGIRISQFSTIREIFPTR